MPITTCVFDAYGTLFDVSAAAREAAAEPGFEALADAWPQIAADWRRKQLEYTWLRAITGEHKDFWHVTEDGLDWALDAAQIDSPHIRDRLLQLYRELTAYGEVPDMLRKLKDAGFTIAILSNGSPDMLNAAVSSAGLETLLDDVLSVEAVGIFKPAKAVYDMVGNRFATTPDQVLFVSSNGWDAAGAKHFGFNTAWVNRAGDPVDRMGHTPDHQLPDLTLIPDIAKGDI